MDKIVELIVLLVPVLLLYMYITFKYSVKENKPETATEDDNKIENNNVDNTSFIDDTDDINMDELDMLVNSSLSNSNSHKGSVPLCESDDAINDILKKYEEEV